MRKPAYSGQFKRDVKQAKKRGKDMDKLKSVLRLLIEGNPLPSTYLDHPLRGVWLSGCTHRTGLAADLQGC